MRYSAAEIAGMEAEYRALVSENIEINKDLEALARLTNSRQKRLKAVVARRKAIVTMLGKKSEK